MRSAICGFLGAAAGGIGAVIIVRLMGVVASLEWTNTAACFAALAGVLVALMAGFLASFLEEERAAEKRMREAARRGRK